MDTTSLWDECKIFKILINGREADRNMALEIIKSELKNERSNIDFSRLRHRIIDWLMRFPIEYNEKEKEIDQPSLWTRSWLLGILARICKDDKEAESFVRERLLSDKEPRWVRYWILEGLKDANVSDLGKLTLEIYQRKDETDLVRMVSVAILALNGDNEIKSKSSEEIRKNLAEGNENIKWITLRALRIEPGVVFSEKVAEKIFNIVNEGEYADSTYQAIIVLGNIYSELKNGHNSETATKIIEKAAVTLSSFIKSYRRNPLRDSMRTKAIIALGNLKVKNEADLLIEEILDDNPEIGREAARSLEKVLDIKIATPRILEAARSSPDIRRIANALRYMKDCDFFIEELEVDMISGPLDQQEIARKLLIEMGGTAAFQKFYALKKRTEAMDDYIEIMKVSKKDIQEQFETVVEEAKVGFDWITCMDKWIFGFGLFLIAISAISALIRGSMDNWATGLAGGGTAGVIYSKFLAKSGDNVQKAVDRMSQLNILFFAYLRQLHQIDQAFARRLLDEKAMTPQEIGDFSEKVEKALKNAINILRG